VRALAAVLAVLTLVVAVAAGRAAAATTVGTFAAAPGATIAGWTPARRAAAEPMSVLPVSRAGTLDGSPLLGASATSTSADSATSASPAVTTGAVEGVDTGDPTLFPNRANGTVYGEYLIEGKAEDYQCSGSVIHSPQGDVVLTAGHCVIDPETGAVARQIVFVPGYRELKAPFGIFAATNFVTTPEWSSTAGTSDPDEAGDLALLVLAPNTKTGQSVEATVGSLAIAFEQLREQTYTQWGYPGEAPYPEGEILYSHTTPYAGVDPFYPAAERPIKIASDFTAGASGGPWTVGPASAPTVLSLTDYYYEGDPRHLYGAYFGSVARRVYETATGVVVPSVTTAAPTVPAAPTPAPAPSVSPPSVTPAPAPTPAPSPATGSLRIVAAHARSTHGEATVVVHLGGPGTLRLSGPAVRTVSTVAEVAGNYRLAVSAKAGGAAARALRLHGSVTVGVGIRFTSPVGVRHASRLVRLFTRPN